MRVDCKSRGTVGCSMGVVGGVGGVGEEEEAEEEEKEKEGERI